MSTCSCYTFCMESAIPSAINPEPVTPAPQSGQTAKDPHGITIAAMAMFVLLSLGAVMFLYNQNQQLKSMLASYQQAQVSPTPAATADPTANWKAQKFADITFKYPSDWALGGMGERIIMVHPKYSKSAQEFPGISLSWIDNPENLSVKEYDERLSKEGPSPNLYSSLIGDNKIVAGTRTINGIVGYYLKDTNCEPLGCDKFSFVYNKKIYVIVDVFEAGQGEEQFNKELLRTTFDQILSTFKFSSPAASPSAEPVACTLEAKICPDGTSVGRTGPNCEFAPCPTP